MSRIILMRHGQEGVGSRLTERGIKQSVDVAKQMINEGIVPDVILHSPVLRA